MKLYYPKFPGVCGFAVFADLVLCLTLTSEHPQTLVNKFELVVLTCLCNFGRDTFYSRYEI